MSTYAQFITAQLLKLTLDIWIPYQAYQLNKAFMPDFNLEIKILLMVYAVSIIRCSKNYAFEIFLSFIAKKEF